MAIGAQQAAAVVVRAALERCLLDAPRSPLTSLDTGEDQEFEASDGRAWLRARLGAELV